jgi:hypothetical protein
MNYTFGKNIEYLLQTSKNHLVSNTPAYYIDTTSPVTKIITPAPPTARCLCPSSPPAAAGPPSLLSLSSSAASACGMVTVGGTAKNAPPPQVGGNVNAIIAALFAVVLPAAPTMRHECSVGCVVLRVVVVSVVPQRGRRRPAFAPHSRVNARRRDAAGDDVVPLAPCLPCIQDHDLGGESCWSCSSGWR